MRFVRLFWRKGWMERWFLSVSVRDWILLLWWMMWKIFLRIVRFLRCFLMKGWVLWRILSFGRVIFSIFMCCSFWYFCFLCIRDSSWISMIKLWRLLRKNSRNRRKINLKRWRRKRIKRKMGEWILVKYK